MLPTMGGWFGREAIGRLGLWIYAHWLATSGREVLPAVRETG